MIGRRIGRFLILSKLGEGGMATVWKARDELVLRDVAFKVLDEKLSNSAKVRLRFEREARTAGALIHPGVVGIYDSGEADGVVYIAMRLVDGMTLSERLAGGLLPIEETVRVVIAAAEALGYAHELGILHRDVTSRNLMMGRDGRVYLMDFGLARATWENRLTSTGTTMGTPLYMAPELIIGHEADVRSDVYGLGVVFYEALTGALPHGKPAAVHPDWPDETRRPRVLRPEIPEALEHVVLRSIAWNREDRYASVGALAADLRALRREAGGPIGL